MKSLSLNSCSIVGGILLVVVVGAAAGFFITRGGRDRKLLSDALLEPLGNLDQVKYVIDGGTSNISIDPLGSGEQTLISGDLQYGDAQGAPTHRLEMGGGEPVFHLQANPSAGLGLQLPWKACAGATDWQLHLSPQVSSAIDLHSGGGNLSLDLTGMAISRLAADTGGGNINLVLPDSVSSLDLSAKTGGGDVNIDFGSQVSGSNVLQARSGAGNVTVRLPAGLAARIHASKGMGKLIIDAGFEKLDEQTYQSADYENAIDRIELTLYSGAGNVTVATR